MDAKKLWVKIRNTKIKHSIKIVRTSAMLVVSLTMLPIHAVHQLPAEKNVALLARSLIYWPESVVCVAHETAHAVAAKVLLGSPINIHLGAYYEELSKEVQKKDARKAGISTHGFDFSKGYCFYRTPKRARDVFIINSAGPLIGIVTALLLLTCANRIPTSHKIAKGLLESVKHVIRYEILHQIVYGLTPFYQSDGGDGYRVWQACGLSQETLQKLSQVDSRKTVLTCCFNVLRLKWLYELTRIARMTS